VFDRQEELMRLAVIATVALALTSGPARGDEFPMTYMGGKPGFKKKTDGVLAVEQTEMYFKDRRARRLFAFASDGTQASLVAKEKESAGCTFGVVLLAVMTAGMVNRDEAACKGADYFVEVKTNRAEGTETIRFRSNREQAGHVTDAINLWVAKTGPTPGKASREEH
jgi:hypothetical protein